MAAQGDASLSSRRRALEELAQAYWFPLYAFVRRSGESADSAEDFVQGFFARLLEKDFLAQVDRSKGRFRSFLLAAIGHYMSNQRAMQRAIKRGGGKKIIPLDSGDAEARYRLEPVESMTPERLFDRRWALTVLDQALARLREEYTAAGKAELYATVESFLTADREKADYSAAAGRLGWPEGTVRVAVHRLRRRYRDLLRSQIAQTVETPEQVEEEISHLLDCL
ncbi:MAG: sigma-70 family RNA polymerase sigma factor [Planctomycetaceae bacterium]|nr:sigma-70 family RNA polymerase sigma factor [Planctomycetaceae bacterium]